MGLGTKIKEALNGDSRRHYNTTDTSRTPGSYPSDEVPRSIGHDSAYDSHNSDSEIKPEKETDKSSPKYTYGSTRNRREMNNTDVVEDNKAGGVARTGTTGGTGTAKLQGKRLNKGNKDPYWGDADTTGVNGVSAAADTYDRTGTHPNAQEINERYKSTTAHEDFASNTPTNLAARGGDDELAPAVRSGRLHDDEDEELGHQGFDRRYEPARHDDNLEARMAERNLAWRPHNSAAPAHARDVKVDEYGAPTSSVGRGKPGLVGVLAATRLADRHHEADLRGEEAVDTSRWGGRGGGDTYDMASPQTTGVETGMHGSNFNNTTNTAAAGTNHASVGTFGKHPTALGSGYGRGEGLGAENVEGGRDSEVANGREHFGPGHMGAKVMHRCYNCGADNDITKHFRKDAVYRMS